MKQIRMNGIRLSNPQVGVSQTCPVNAAASSGYLYRFMAVERINMMFLNLFCADDFLRINCCISPEKQAKVEELTLRDHTGVTCRPRIGTVSVYPHQFSFAALGYLLYIFGKKRFSFHQMASSGAMLAFVVDYAHQEMIAAGLEQQLRLPITRTPFRQDMDTDEILAMLRKRPETSAEYVEAKVRTYGINAKSGLTLCSLIISGEALADWGARIRVLEDCGLRFAFTSAETLPDGRIRLFFLSDGETAGSEPAAASVNMNGCPSMLSSVLDGADGEMAIVPEVCLISLQGPHFGDRYGIGDYAFSVLMRESVPLLLAACVGAMIYIVVPDAAKQQSKSLLSQVFETP
jgi:hypothetical protein